MTCTFFGHRNVSERGVKESLRAILVELIENKNVSVFYVGNQGHFDFLVQKVLKELKTVYPHIKYGIALAYIPKEKEEYENIEYDLTFVPEGVENGPIRFAIDRRNRWLIKNSDFVVTCVDLIIGGAAKYKEIAEKKGKTVINIIPQKWLKKR